MSAGQESGMRWNEWIDERGDTVAVLSDEEQERFADLVDLKLVGRRADGTLVWRRISAHVPGFCPPQRTARRSGMAREGWVMGRRRRLAAGAAHRRRARP